MPASATPAFDSVARARSTSRPQIQVTRACGFF
jgi:hypothetical protein